MNDNFMQGGDMILHLFVQSAQNGRVCVGPPPTQDQIGLLCVRRT